MAKKKLKNTEVILDIESVCGNGNGFSHLEDGMAVFVTGAAEGDKVRALIIKETKTYAVAKMVEVLEPSSHRIADPCTVGGKCGGCVFGHVDYAFESEYKRTRIEECLSHIGGLDIKLSAFHAAKDTRAYRNKAIYPVGKNKDGRMTYGFYARNSHRIVEHDGCVIGKPEFEALASGVIDYCERAGVIPYDEASCKGLLRGIYIRGAESGELYLTLIINAKKLLSDDFEKEFTEDTVSSFPKVVGISLNINTEPGNAVLSDEWRTLYGDGFLRETLLGKKFRISPAAFFQVNKAQTEVLYSEAARFAEIKPGETVLDLYCGTGTIGICLAKDGCRLVGVEVSKEATVDAAFNVKENGLGNAEFICLDAGEALNSERVKSISPDTVILDPPRKGCGSEAVERICSLGAPKIVYISCDPATLARDIADFTRLGYEVKDAVGVDLFPRTGHVETVVLLSKAV